MKEYLQQTFKKVKQPRVNFTEKDPVAGSEVVMQYGTFNDLRYELKYKNKILTFSSHELHVKIPLLI